MMQFVEVTDDQVLIRDAAGVVRVMIRTDDGAGEGSGRPMAVFFDAECRALGSVSFDPTDDRLVVTLLNAN
ncbi:unnamed protein product, partial [marine sediment metagenome]